MSPAKLLLTPAPEQQAHAVLKTRPTAYLEQQHSAVTLTLRTKDVPSK